MSRFANNKVSSAGFESATFSSASAHPNNSPTGSVNKLCSKRGPFSVIPEVEQKKEKKQKSFHKQRSSKNIIHQNDMVDEIDQKHIKL